MPDYNNGQYQVQTVCVFERERDRQTDRQTDKQTEGEGERVCCLELGNVISDDLRCV